MLRVFHELAGLLLLTWEAELQLAAGEPRQGPCMYPAPTGPWYKGSGPSAYMRTWRIWPAL